MRVEACSLNATRDQVARVIADGRQRELAGAVTGGTVDDVARQAGCSSTGSGRSATWRFEGRLGEAPPRSDKHVVPRSEG
jgi:hypothetical protein